MYIQRFQFRGAVGERGMVGEDDHLNRPCEAQYSLIAYTCKRIFNYGPLGSQTVIERVLNALR